MKKLLAIAILSLVSAGAFAQTTQGTIVVSGALGFSKSTDKFQEQYSSYVVEQKSTNFGIRPTIGYMLKQGLETGVILGYNYTKTKTYHNVYAGTGETTAKVYDIGTFVRKYFMLSDKVAFTGTGVIQYSAGKKENKYPSEFTEELKTRGFQAVVLPGITVFPTERISIGLNFGSLGYTKSESGYNYPAYKDPEEEGESTKFGLDLNSSTLSLNFAFHFNR